MLLYHYLRFWLGNALRLWYKKVYFHFEAPIPKDVAVIFACTHPNSVIDYCFIPLITKKKTHVLVRGDVFEKPWLNKFFRNVWMMPVYRMRDGYSNVNLNDESFRECHQLFDQNGRVLIFSEGLSVQEKTLQPIKKGTARLALDYLKSGENKEVYIVPVANNYTKFRGFRATVMTNFGTPIKTSNYRDLYKENPNQAYLKLTQEISDSLSRNLIQVDRFSEDCLTEKALDVIRLNRLDHRKDWIIEDESVFKEEKLLVDRFNTKGENALDKTTWEKIDRFEISDVQEGFLKMNKNRIVQFFVYYTMAIFIGFAGVFFMIPQLVTNWILKTKIKDRLFENTVIVVGGTVIYMIQIFLLYMILTGLFGWTGFVITSSFLALGFIYIAVIDEYRFAKYNRRKLKYKQDFADLYEKVRSV